MRNSPVLIAGAGLGGLSTAVFLGLQGVRALVVERHPGLSAQPKARGQMPPTMEALAAAGLAGRFADAAPPGRPETAIVVAADMAGPPWHRFTAAAGDYSRFSPQPEGLASQARAERILAGRARELGAEIRFGTEAESIQPRPDGVTVALRDLASGEVGTVSPRYLVAADGHKGTIRAAAGIGVQGRRRRAPASAMFASFEADLRPALDGAAVGLWHLQNPALPHGNATVISTDEPGRFVIGGAFSPADAEPERLAGHIRTAAGRPGLSVRILDVAWTSTGTWITRVADRFRAGPVLLVGDAAHLMPPTGGQGGNAAVLDAWHLAWKLAAVLAGDAGDRLLDSHDAERRPYAGQLAEQQYASYVQRIDPALADESVAEAIDPVRGLFGYVCPAGAFLPESGPGGELFEDPAEPSGRPGARAPHALAPGGRSVRDLLGRGFLLLAGERAEQWRQAAAGLRPVVAVHALDEAGRARYRLPAGGATLVRPDGVIAWRSADPGALAAALHAVLH
jgi:putative polyketide hydroxylase